MAERRLRHPAARVPAGASSKIAPAPRLIAAGLVLVLLVAGVVAGGWAMGRAVTPQPAGAFANCHTRTQLGPRHYAGPPAICISLHRKYLAQIDTTKGRIGVLMDPGLAPKTVNNFIVLAVNGYYNGLEFFRGKSWVVQTGDPLENGTGGPGYTLPPEGKPGHFAQGAVGMARVPGGPINGGQFFIMLGSWPAPGPGSTIYNRFGGVLQGFGLLSTLTKGDRILDIHVKPD